MFVDTIPVVPGSGRVAIPEVALAALRELGIEHFPHVTHHLFGEEAYPFLPYGPPCRYLKEGSVDLSSLTVVAKTVVPAVYTEGHLIGMPLVPGVHLTESANHAFAALVCYYHRCITKQEQPPTPEESTPSELLPNLGETHVFFKGKVTPGTPVWFYLAWQKAGAKTARLKATFAGAYEEEGRMQLACCGKIEGVALDARTSRPARL